MARKCPAGSTITLEKGPSDNAGYYVIDFIDLEDVPAPLTMPAGYVSITSSGAVSNGTTDNSAAIQSCVNANSKVWIPQGNFASLSTEISVPAGVTVRGAGMWYSVISGYYATFNMGGNNDQFYNFALLGNTVNRNDSLSDSGFNFGAGTGSELQNIWVEHEKCGYWVGNGTSPTSNGLLITNCRFRDLYADGVNFCNGTSNSTVTQCNFRNTGDDSMASWSPTEAGSTLAICSTSTPFNALGAPMALRSMEAPITASRTTFASIRWIKRGSWSSRDSLLMGFLGQTTS